MQQNKSIPPTKVERIFEQGPDLTSFYSDFTQVINPTTTLNEINS